MKNKIVVIGSAALILGIVAALTTASTPGIGPVPENIKSLLGKRCAVCHRGRNPSGSLNLEPANIQAVIDAPSRQAPAMKIVDSADPEASYLLKKIRRAKDIKGQPMPPGKALARDEAKALEAWIAGLAR